MSKRMLLTVACCLLSAAIVATGGPVSANDQTADRVKATVWEIGSGEHARIAVKLDNGAVLKGYIGELGNNDFTVVSKTGTQKVLYSEAVKVKRQKLHVGIKIAIIAGVVIGVLLGAMYASCGSGGCS